MIKMNDNEIFKKYVCPLKRIYRKLEFISAFSQVAGSKGNIKNQLLYYATATKN